MCGVQIYILWLENETSEIESIIYFKVCFESKSRPHKRGNKGNDVCMYTLTNIQAKVL